MNERSPYPLRFGRQRPAIDVVALVALLAGFSALAYAVWVYLNNRFGVLLPIFFLVGVYASLRIEVRELELRSDRLLISTFFRKYPVPRNHVTNVSLTRDGAAIDVLNGRRYLITPPGVDAEALAVTLAKWLRGEDLERVNAGSEEPAAP